MNIKNKDILNQMAVAKGWLIKTFLLLLLLFVACGDGDDFMQLLPDDNDEIELTVKTNVPGLGTSTRTAPETENITSITALAFNSDTTLIKVTKATLTRDVSNGENNSLSGTMTITVPLRTRFIHFIAKNNADFTEITDDDLGKTARGLLIDRITRIDDNSSAESISNALHYWGMLTFANAESLTLQANVTLYRNMAKLTLTLNDGITGHIAGILNYNTTGTIVPYNENGEFGYQTETNHLLPTTFEITSDVETDKQLGTVHYLFEEYNDVGDLIYVICKINDLYYKIALVKPDITDVDYKYYYIIRNQVYNIKINGVPDTELGKESYQDAVVNGYPINDTEPEQVHLEFEPDKLIMYIGEPGTVTVSIPEGITELQIGYPVARIDDGGISVETTAGESVNPTKETETNSLIFIDTYDVTGLSEIVLNINLKQSVTDAISGMEIQFIGSGELKYVNNKLMVDVLKRDVLNVTPATVEIPKSAGNQFYVDVYIPSFDNYEGVYVLTVTDTDNKYNITAPGNLVLQNGVYNVTKGEKYTFTFTLREDGNVGDEHTIDFHLATDYHNYDGQTTVTLINDAVQDQDTYEIWVENSAWDGNENSVEFFGYNSTEFTSGSNPDGFRTDFYDGDANSGANAHRTQSMVMGSDDSFTFTIPEGENRWLTMLVAANSGSQPSIDLHKDGVTWTTTADANATTVPYTYNFGNGEIGTDGRLIRYELPAGTYTLQGSDAAAYLLYYMRVSTERPTMTDVAQPLLTDYTLSWSGGKYADTDGKGYLKISDEKHIVDEDNLTHTVLLKADNSLSLKTSLNLTSDLSTFDLYITQPTYTFVEPNDDNNNNGSITIGNDNLDEYKNIVPSSELRLENNGGDYVLSGKIIEPDYKYSAFYDVLQLNQVEYEVKNPIVPALYNSMDGDKLTPVENWTTMDDAWAIGFFMPTPMPIEYASASDRPAIAISIPGWTKSDSGTSSGLGVVVDSENKIYTLTTQDNSVHPRPGWTYKIQWADRASSTISPEIVDKSSDVYFTYMGTIAKKVDVVVPEIKETSLNIKLDFYADVDGDGNIDNYGNNFNNLLLNTSRVFLKATLSGNVPQSGEIVQLQGEFTSPYEWANANGAIHWDKSKQDDNSDNDDIIYYGDNHNGTGLQFTIQDGKTEYFIDWVFQTGDNYSRSGDIEFTYKLSNNQGYTVTGDVGDNSPTFAFVNEPTNNGQIQVATNNQSGTTANLPLYYSQNSAEEFTVDVTVPAGVTQLNIQADDFDVSWVDGNNVSTLTSITTSGGETMRFKFTLKDTSHTDKNSTITFSGNNNVASAIVNVDLSPRASEPSGETTIWNGWAQLNWAHGINYLSTGYQIPVGSRVTLNFTTTGGSIKLHDVNGGGDIIVLPGVNYGGDDNLGIIPVGSGLTEYSFDVTNEIKIYNQNIDGYINGLKINGDNVILTSIVVSTSGSSPTETVIFDYNFNNNTQPNGYEFGGGTSTFENGTLSFTATGTGSNDWDNQIRFTGLSIVNGATYKLTFKIKSNVSDSTGLDIAFDDPSDNYSWCGAFSEKSLKLNDSGNFTEVTLTTTATKTIDNNARLFINLGHLGDCTIEIDDLKLVRTN